MSYTPAVWADDAIGGTPITADALNHIENGIADVVGDVADLAATVGGLAVPGVVTVTANTTLGATHINKVVLADSASGITIKLDVAQEGNWPLGTSTRIVQANTGQVSVVANLSETVNLNPYWDPITRGAWSVIEIIRVASATYVVTGDLQVD